MTYGNLDLEGICASRPIPDAGLEQFLMTSKSVRHQASYLHNRLRTDLFMMGDDDHVSLPVAAAAPERRVLVIEIDERVLDSIDTWRRKLNLRNLILVHADLRTYDEPMHKWPAFYVNPPWSS